MEFQELKSIASNISILYVEDEQKINESVTSFLKKIFDKVVTTLDGQEALKKYKEESFDIVISDIQMPKMDGIDLIQEIRKINFSQVIIVTSAHNELDNLTQLFNNHVNRFLLKPYDFDLFITTLYLTVKNIKNEKKLRELILTQKNLLKELRNDVEKLLIYQKSRNDSTMKIIEKLEESLM